MKIIAITQARTGSSRLPNKILKKIKQKSILEIHIDRIRKSKLIDELIVATTDKIEDDIIEIICKKIDVKYFRGDELNVLDRFYKAVSEKKPDYIIRLTSDCPLIDAKLIDDVIAFTINNNLDYASNNLIESFPDGQDIEVFKFNALKTAWKNAKLNSEKEHVTPYIKKNGTFNNGKVFKTDNFFSIENYGNLRMTLDVDQDFITIKKIIEILGTDKSWIEYSKYIIKHPEIVKNNDEIRNEGYTKSLNKD